MSLFGLGLITQVNLSLKHGHTDVSAYGYVSYGFLLIVLFEQYALAYEFGRLGLALNEKFQNTQLTCQLHVVFAMGLHFRRPLREALELNRKGYRAGLEYGDMNYSAYGGYASLSNRLVLGDELPSVAADAEQYIKISTRAQEVSSTATMTIVRQLIANLLGETESPQSLGNAHFDEADFRARQEADVKPLILGRYYIYKLMLHYLRGDYYNALAEGERAEHLMPGLAGLFESTLYTFYMGLTLAALARVSSEEHRGAYTDRIGRHLASLSRWAESCPQNFAHQEALLRAEMADLTGSPEATELYRLAIEAATQSDFVPDQALANRLAARHHLARGRQGEATALLLVARRGYARWGATALVTLLDDQHRTLMYGDASPDERYIRESDPLGAGAASAFDALMVLRVAQTLAGEIVLTKLIEQIMRTVMIHAGARRGLLILEREGRLIVEALITHDPDVVQLDVAEPVEGSELLAASIVHYVARTRETVVLGDASRVDRFAGDRHIERYKPKSVLCLALTHQGRLIGLLYLENNLATNVFAAEQVDLIRMLSSHAAISVQNALLYANVERMTAELRTSNAELLTVNQRLQAELVERERSERERARLQDEVIQVQQARLAELSTPLIPITDKIMVMPIIGTVDQSRASRVVEAALAGAHQSRAAVVILDVTGLKHVDTSAINSLMQTAQSLRLLGTAVVITGVRSDMAQTLVNLGIDLGAMVVRGTLQSGIAYALEGVGDNSGAFGRS
jgi:GAF domain-containing protein/ABC-type transporter Mla MlaB component